MIENLVWGKWPASAFGYGWSPPKELNYLYTALQTAVFFSIRLYAFCLYLINGSRDQGHEHSGPLSQMKGLNCLNPKCQSVCGAVFYHGVQAVSWGSPSSRLSWWRNENFFWVLLLAAPKSIWTWLSSLSVETWGQRDRLKCWFILETLIR